MKVQIISKENIKPSSPTPQHLGILKISLFDQIILSPYAPFIFFYLPSSADTIHIQNRIKLLKKSLSTTLTQFYPLAGRIKDHLSIDCNDEGALFVQARINCRLNDFLANPDLLFLTRLLPCDNVIITEYPIEGIYASNFQVTIFECGGMAMAVSLSHKIIDGGANRVFFKAWTAYARGCSSEAPIPNFLPYSADLFIPASNLWLNELRRMWGSLSKKGKCTTRRFYFDATAVAALKSEATSQNFVPTRVEAVSAFLWKCGIAASMEKYGFQRPSVFIHLVNLRRRLSLPPAVTESAIGNLFWIAVANSTENCLIDMPSLVRKLREAVSEINADFVGIITSEKRESVILQYFRRIMELGSRNGNDCFYFVSWSKIGMYEADFGWGKPVWVSSVGLDSPAVRNFCIVNEIPSGDGLEAWVTLDEPEMAIVERNPELLRIASLNPNPLTMHSTISRGVWLAQRMHLPCNEAKRYDKLLG